MKIKLLFAATIIAMPLLGVAVSLEETVNEVFHFAETLCVSIKKNNVAAISAIEINQKLIPTKSSDFKFFQEFNHIHL